MKIVLTLANMLALKDADLDKMTRDELQRLRSKLSGKILNLENEVGKALTEAEASGEWATYKVLEPQCNALIKIRQSVINRLS